MEWQAIFLPEAFEDLEALQGRGSTAEEVERAIRSEFTGPKGDRLWKFLTQGATTGKVDRLEGSQFHGSIRLQVMQDYRATVVCLPAVRAVVVVHVFAKSRDPDYRAAVKVHDERFRRFTTTLGEFTGRKGRR